MFISYALCYLFDRALSLFLTAPFLTHTHSRSSSQSFNRKSSTMKCAVHFYDMLHSFGKAKHIFTLESTVRKFSFHIPPSFLSSNPHGFSFFSVVSFSLAFISRSSEWQCRSAFHFFAVHFVTTSVFFFAAPSFSLALSSTLYFIFSSSPSLSVWEGNLLSLSSSTLHFTALNSTNECSVLKANLTGNNIKRNSTEMKNTIIKINKGTILCMEWDRDRERLEPKCCGT